MQYKAKGRAEYSETQVAASHHSVDSTLDARIITLILAKKCRSMRIPETTDETIVSDLDAEMAR
jgi:hypothetical protein